MSVLLHVKHLRKTYGDVVAVDDLSFEVSEGSCFGLLGPNGAGKSTTFEMLESLIPPSSGQILFRGEPLKPKHRERIGLQLQSTALQDHLTVRDNLKLFRALYRHGLAIEQLISMCRLEAFIDRDHRHLSGGQRQRLLLAIALINDPDLVFLDEPTTGLDPQSRRNLWELVQDIKARGKTVLLSTHYMDEAYQLCDEIAIMDHGRIIARGKPQQLLAEHFNESVIELPAAEFDAHPVSLAVHRRDDIVEIVTADINHVLQTLLAAGLSLAQIRIRPPTLEDLFLRLTGTELRA